MWYLIVSIPDLCTITYFDWSNSKIKSFLHFDKNPCVGIFDNCLDFTVLDCVDNKERHLTNCHVIEENRHQNNVKAYINNEMLQRSWNLSNRTFKIDI